MSMDPIKRAFQTVPEESLKWRPLITLARTKYLDLGANMR